MKNINIQKSFHNQNPTLYLVATPIGNLQEMSPRAITVLKNVDLIAAEDTRVTRKLLTFFDIKTKLISYHKHNEQSSAEGIIELLKEGKNIALVSDAGYPLVADPGLILVKKVLRLEYNVVTISGSNATLNALTASGLSTQKYAFQGFMEGNKKKRREELERVKEYLETLVYYVPPHDLSEFLKIALEVFGNREVCLGRELTKIHEEYIRGDLNSLLATEIILKGELVVVIAGKQEDRNINLEALVMEVVKLVKKGSKVKDAVKNISNQNKVSKNLLYNEYLKYNKK